MGTDMDTQHIWKADGVGQGTMLSQGHEKQVKSRA